LAILVAPKRDFLVTTTIHDVVNRPGVSNTDVASHKDQPRTRREGQSGKDDNMFD
jgi:hypothetical protein